ncbi:MAG: MFS transporter [Candidatus Sericytochromatia bacterium]|nr:MFS transporter [Candidatus Sericytochromatia bacterium]
MAIAETPVPPPAPPRGLTLRWVVLALVFLAGTLNYIDRQVLALIKPVLSQEFGWNDQDFGHLASVFQFSAALTFLYIGWLLDRFGLHRGYPLGVGVWSLACAAHGLAVHMWHFMMARVVLAAGEAVQTPASMKAIAEWFPAAQRSLAVGIINTSPNIGAIIAPLLVPAVVLAWGWRTAFIVTGALGLVWLLGWFALPRPRQREALPTPSETPASEADAPLSVRALLAQRSSWALLIGKALTDMVWWFLLFWAPDFMHRQFHLSIKTAGAPLAAIYGLAAVGALTGGLLPTFLMARGVSLNVARKGSMLLYALIITPLPLVLQVSDPWLAVLFIGGALFAHQGFSTNLFTVAVDAFPGKGVGTVVSIGAFCGNISGMAMLELTGWVLTHHNTYMPMFAISASVYLIALAVLHGLVPRLRRLPGRA